MKKSLLITLAALATLSAGAQEAFPGAEGYGRNATGGRGGAVYHVTTLDDNNQPGSFRYACTRSGTRTIVFDVSGTIYLKSELRLNQGNVTIAGQTAPGDGICIADYPFSIAASNVIIRFMRFRVGNRQVAYHEGDGLGGMDQRNIIIDHCSVSWSIDECLSLYGSTNTTVQWCIASHSLSDAGHSKGKHGYGGNWGGSGASYHHNLIANHSSRTPRLGPRQDTQTDERMDMRNNVIYNYGSLGCYGGEGMNVNMVNNYYKPGPTSNNRKNRIAGIGIRTLEYCFDSAATLANINRLLGTNLSSVTIRRTQGQNVIVFSGVIHPIDMEKNTIEHEGKVIPVVWNGWKPMLHKWGTFYVDGNVNSYDANVKLDNWGVGMYPHIDTSANDYTFTDDVKAQMKLAKPIPFTYTTTHTAEQAYERVLDNVGASLHRDAYDQIVISDVRKGTASFGNAGIIDSQNEVKYSDGTTGWPALTSETAPVDTDGDGMPDAWETANGLNPNDPNDGKLAAGSGYTNLERYLNSLVAHIMEAGNKDGKLYTDTSVYGDPEAELPTEGGEVQEQITEYTVAASTYTGSGANTATWLFGDDVTVSNAKSKAYSAGSNDCVKYSNGTQFTVTFPSDQAVRSVQFDGYDNYDTADAYFSEVAGMDGSAYIFPKKVDGAAVMASHTVVMPPTVGNSFTFTPKGNQLVLKLTVKCAKSAALGEIIPDAAATDCRIFNLMGVECHAPLAPGIYITRGKKFIVR